MKSENEERQFEERPFSFRSTRDGRVFIAWGGREVKCLRGREAERFLAAVKGAALEAQQLAMARVTGNFKRGNERRDQQLLRRGEGYSGRVLSGEQVKTCPQLFVSDWAS